MLFDVRQNACDPSSLGLGLLTLVLILAQVEATDCPPSSGVITPSNGSSLRFIGCTMVQVTFLLQGSSRDISVALSNCTLLDCVVSIESPSSNVSLVFFNSSWLFYTSVTILGVGTGMPSSRSTHTALSLLVTDTSCLWTSADNTPWLYSNETVVLLEALLIFTRVNFVAAVCSDAAECAARCGLGTVEGACASHSSLRGAMINSTFAVSSSTLIVLQYSSYYYHNPVIFLNLSVGCNISVQRSKIRGPGSAALYLGSATHGTVFDVVDTNITSFSAAIYVGNGHRQSDATLNLINVNFIVAIALMLEECSLEGVLVTIRSSYLDVESCSLGTIRFYNAIALVNVTLKVNETIADLRDLKSEGNAGNLVRLESRNPVSTVSSMAVVLSNMVVLTDENSCVIYCYGYPLIRNFSLRLLNDHYYLDPLQASKSTLQVSTIAQMEYCSFEFSPFDRKGRLVWVNVQNTRGNRIQFSNSYLNLSSPAERSVIISSGSLHPSCLHPITGLLLPSSSDCLNAVTVTTSTLTGSASAAVVLTNVTGWVARFVSVTVLAMPVFINSGGNVALYFESILLQQQAARTPSSPLWGMIDGVVRENFTLTITGCVVLSQQGTLIAILGVVVGEVRVNLNETVIDTARIVAVQRARVGSVSLVTSGRVFVGSGLLVYSSNVTNSINIALCDNFGLMSNSSLAIMLQAAVVNSVALMVSDAALVYNFGVLLVIQGRSNVSVLSLDIGGNMLNLTRVSILVATWTLIMNSYIGNLVVTIESVHNDALVFLGQLITVSNGSAVINATVAIFDIAAPWAIVDSLVLADLTSAIGSADIRIANCTSLKFFGAALTVQSYPKMWLLGSASSVPASLVGMQAMISLSLTLSNCSQLVLSSCTFIASLFAQIRNVTVVMTDCYAQFDDSDGFTSLAGGTALCLTVIRSNLSSLSIYANMFHHSSFAQRKYLFVECNVTQHVCSCTPLSFLTIEADNPMGGSVTAAFRRSVLQGYTLVANITQPAGQLVSLGNLTVAITVECSLWQGPSTRQAMIPLRRTAMAPLLQPSVRIVDRIFNDVGSVVLECGTVSVSLTYTRYHFSQTIPVTLPPLQTESITSTISMLSPSRSLPDLCRSRWMNISAGELISPLNVTLLRTAMAQQPTPIENIVMHFPVVGVGFTEAELPTNVTLPRDIVHCDRVLNASLVVYEASTTPPSRGGNAPMLVEVKRIPLNCTSGTLGLTAGTAPRMFSLLSTIVIPIIATEGLLTVTSVLRIESSVDWASMWFALLVVAEERARLAMCKAHHSLAQLAKSSPISQQPINITPHMSISDPEKYAVQLIIPRIVTVGTDVIATAVVSPMASFFSAMSQGSSLSATTAIQRSALQRSLVACDWSLEDALDVSLHPLGFGFGPSAGHYLRGSIVGNMLLIVAVCVVSSIVPLLWGRKYVARRKRLLESLRSSDPLRYLKATGQDVSNVELVMLSLSKFSLPGYLLPFFAFFLQQLVSSGIALIIHVGDAGAGAGDIALGLFALLCSGGVVVIVVYMTTIGFFAEGSDASSEHSSNEESLILKKIFGHRFVSLITPKYVWLPKGPKDEGYAMREYLLEMLHPIFGSYRPTRQWFGVVGLATTVVGGIVGGIFPSDPNVCQALTYVTASLSLVTFVVAIALRPFDSPSDFITSHAINAVGCLWAIGAYASLAGVMEVASLVQVWASVVSLVMLFLELVVSGRVRKLWLNVKDTFTLEESIFTAAFTRKLRDMLPSDEPHKSQASLHEKTRGLIGHHALSTIMDSSQPRGDDHRHLAHSSSWASAPFLKPQRNESPTRLRGSVASDGVLPWSSDVLWPSPSTTSHQSVAAVGRGSTVDILRDAERVLSKADQLSSHRYLIGRDELLKTTKNAPPAVRRSAALRQELMSVRGRLRGITSIDELSDGATLQNEEAVMIPALGEESLESLITRICNSR